MPVDWLEQLNDSQRAAATFADGPLLVVAGAGTGKTRTLVARVASLLERGVAPERILLLTFTRRAAAEMLRRVDSMVGRSVQGKVWGGTFHATANRLLRYYGRSIGLTPDFTVMDQADAADLMNMLRNELRLGDGRKRFPRKETLVSIYSRTVNAQDKLEDVLDWHFPWCKDWRDELGSLFEAYTRRKRSAHVLDYDDLLLMWSGLCADERAGKAVEERFDHVLVDEYQDTNRVQSDILRGLRRENRNLMVVGDDAQSIYSFRAATIRNILDFPAHFPGAAVIKLEDNYRSTTPILATSNAVIAQSKERYEKTLRGDRTGGGRPTLWNCPDEPVQSEQVSRNILEYLERGVALRKQAVLFRAGHHSDHLEVELARRKIPFHKYGGLRFIEAAHIKDMLALLRVLENPYDEISWFRVLLLLPGIGPRTAQKILGHLGVRGPTASPEVPPDESEAIRSPLSRMVDCPPAVPEAARKEFAALGQAWHECGGLRGRGAYDEDGEDAVPLVAQMERLRAFYEPILERRYENSPARRRDLEQLEQVAAGYRSRARLISDLTLDPPTSTSDFSRDPYLEEDYLTLSTIHSAKGCEWDVVHVIHAADGMIPSDMVRDQEGIEEERRLFYVALTRARDALHVYFPLRYYHAGRRFGDAHSFAQLTRFLPPDVRRLFDQRTPTVAASSSVGTMRQIDDRLSRLWGESSGATR